MASLSDVRTRVRLRLEEASAAAWTNDEVDECITAALEEYSAIVPLETTGTAAVSAGDVTCTRPAGAWSIERVVQADGVVLPRRGLPEGSVSGERQAWEEWGGLLRFAQALEAQTLTIWYTTARAITDVVAPDVGIIVAGAVWRCLQQRGVQGLRRRDPAGGTRLIEEAQREYRQMLDRRRRRVRVTLVQRSE